MKPHPEDQPPRISETMDVLGGASALEALEAVEEGFLAVDSSLNVQAVNPAAEQLLGLPRAELLGRSLDSLLGEPAPSPALLEGCRRALAAQVPARLVEHRALAQQWLEIRLHPRRGQVWLFLRDVTRERKAEERLRDFEQQQAVLRYVIANVPHAIFWKDREGRFLGGNQNFLNDCGMGRLENLLGKNDYDIWKREDADFFVQVDRRVMQSGAPELDIEEPVLRADGEQRTLLTSKVPLRDEAGNVTGLLGIYADITERKRMELELQRAKEAAEAAARAKGEFLTVMSHEKVEAGRMQVDCPPSHVLLAPARAAPRLLIAEDNADMRAYLADLLVGEYELELTSTGQQAWEAVKRQRPDVIISDVMMPEVDGSELVSRLKASAQYKDIPIILLTAKASREEMIGGLEAGADDYLGKPFGPAELKARVRAAVRLHETWLKLEARTRELETTLRKLRETQEQLVRKAKVAAVGTLVAGLSHELNNPMAAIRMSVELMTRYALSKESRSMALEVIDRQSLRCARLLKTLLEFSSRPPVVGEPCDIQLAVGRVIELSQPRRLQRDVRLEQRLSGAELLRVYVHATELETALLNVVNNALEASLAGGTVTIEARALAREGVGGVEVTVSDSGTGIPAEMLPHVTEPFFTTKPPGEGIGLGLAITHRFIDAHGGALNIDSEVGRGTTVRMWLPAAPVGEVARALGPEVSVQ